MISFCSVICSTGIVEIWSFRAVNAWVFVVELVNIIVREWVIMIFKDLGARMVFVVKGEGRV